jgi:hypothetical protein
VSEGFSLDWLRLREAPDMRARSRPLARRFAAAVRRRAGDGPALLVDLGAGSGSSFRALAPLIPGEQDWRLIENDPALLGFQAAEIAQWARGQGHPASLGSGLAVVTSGSSVWRAHSVAHDLAAGLDALPLAGAHGVTASAFLDLVSADWLAQLALRLAAAKIPFLAALTVDGRRTWSPAHREDALMEQLFARHQRGDKGFGAALGATAAERAAAIFRGHAYAVATMASDWRLEPGDDGMLEIMIDGAADAAGDVDPDARGRLDRWREARHAARSAGTLRLTVGHVDILATRDETAPNS